MRILVAYPAAPMQRSGSFVLSIAIHAAVVLALKTASQFETVYNPVQDYRVEAIPEKPTVLTWYPIKKSLPPISPSHQIGMDSRPKANELQQPDVLIASNPQPVSTQQMIAINRPVAQLKVEIPAPNMIGVEADPPAKKSREFVPPKPSPAPAKPQLSLLQEDAPNVDLQTPALTAEERRLNLPKPKPRTFAPPAPNRPAATPQNPEVVDVPNQIASDLPKVTAVIVGLNPTSGPPPTVIGNLPGSFARAPEAGNTSSGAKKETTQIEGLAATGSSRPGVNTATAAAANPRDNGVYEFRLPPGTNLISAPLRPTSRNIPRLIEARFADRVVYVLVVPRPNLPGYGGDWTIWFAEQSGQSQAAMPSMRPPSPLRHIAKSNDSPPGLQGRAQLAGVIRADGKPEGFAPLGEDNPQLAALARNELSMWDFRPATRNGQPVAVDVILEIPFNTRQAITAR